MLEVTLLPVEEEQGTNVRRAARRGKPEEQRRRRPDKSGSLETKQTAVLGVGASSGFGARLVDRTGGLQVYDLSLSVWHPSTLSEEECQSIDL